ncbi:hypothetical protein [Streptomyces sp. enrichment culture]
MTQIVVPRIYGEMLAKDRRLRLGGYGDFFITLLTRQQKATL